ncbi:MAG: MarR family winged helix-turn-helix transcriptional regulator [Pseudonocardiaceae bacterium]
MPPPATPPIGLRLASTAKAVSRAFDDALAAAGGSLPSWLVLISLKTQQLATQRALAAAVGIQDATLTHHLNAMEAEGLVTRRRDPTNRRVHLVELTEHGETAFHRMRAAAVTFDKRLRTGLHDDEMAALERFLDHLHRNITEPSDRLP